MAQSYDDQERLLAEVICSPATKNRIRGRYPGSDWMIDATCSQLWWKVSRVVALRRADAGADVYAGLAINKVGEPMGRRDLERLTWSCIRYAHGDVVRLRDRWRRDDVYHDPTWESTTPGPDELVESGPQRERLDLMLRHVGQRRPDLVADRYFLVGLGASLAASSLWAVHQPVPGKGPDKHLFELVDPVQFGLGYKLGGEAAASLNRLSEENRRQIRRRCRAAVRKALAALTDEGVDND